MTERTTRDAVLEVARKLFTERGFTSTTIRDIAEGAGVSPALVMKLTGSKAQLFEAAVPDAPNVDELDHPAEPVGHRMTRALVERRDSGDFEFWAMAPFLLQEAPDRDAARANMEARFVPRIAAAIGEDTPTQVRARLIVSMLLGLASGLRTFELVTPDVIESDRLVATYGALVQAIIDDPAL
ncbi:TetR/AcrR family transcriptional regulator [Rhodococcus phenolicus]|uniref:TetR/AcrR family transcriptional regulator n=1 Tax=Rhodococcus phenolicus TaxID=263849 RepID=UPI00082A6885|nr:TetR/AcrR family transcriptional regulator [Rhodococcus phenolicus]